MTCIVGLKRSGNVLLGGDSAAVIDDTSSIQPCGEEKVFYLGEFMIGYAGSFRIGQLIKHTFKPPKPRCKGVTYMVRQFVPALKKLLRDEGVIEVKDGVQLMGGELIVVKDKELFVIYADFEVYVPKDDYVAIGCGSDIAKGALFVYDEGNYQITSRDMVIRALKASEKFCTGVRGPHYVIEKE